MIALPELTALAGTLAAGLVDARTGLIPDRISRTTTVVTIALAAAGGALVMSCGGALAVGGTLFALYGVTRGRGLGLGDVKLGAAIGAGFGVTTGLIALGAAFIAGGAYAGWLLATGRGRRGDAIRFGPFLAAGALAMSFTSAGALA
jgi:leader peptidase (prepilin peptidase)/N-methyltransferase